MAASSSSSSSSFSHWKYDVFLSFRGEDTRCTFTDHLYKALRLRGVETFMDDKLTRGEYITPALLTAIESSRHAIIVLSQNYPTSKWCLDELVKILDTQKTRERRAVPIFYNVNPSDVGNQRGSFGKAMTEHEEKLTADRENKLKYDMEKLQRWKKALTQVGKISGFTSSPNKPETQFIEEIVKNISKDLKYVSSNDVKNLVGMDSCIKELEPLLCLESTAVRMVGIWGIGGIGKTTLAKVIYEQISCEFEGCCFLEDHLKSNGIDHLKEQLLSRLLGDKNINTGFSSIKARLHYKKVLIVIDNVSDQSILETLVGEHDWFGPQSRIIITTRDRHLLTVHGVDAIYQVRKLEDDKAMELFGRYAFKNSTPTREIMELSHRALAYAQGLPLALKILGCALCHRNKDYWEEKLHELENFPNKEIQKVLQISFDGLDHNEKEIFLDIACFFRGSNRTHVIKILEGCGFFPVSRVENLIDKSLIDVTYNGKLDMHDLLQEMGWQIVHQMSPREPGKRSRLWKQEDVSHVLKRNTGTEKVEGIFLDLFDLKEINFTTEAFAGMKNLRLLQIYESEQQYARGDVKCKVWISRDFKFHCHELRYLFWHEYPLESLPCDFESENLVYLCMPYSYINRAWEGNKVFKNLKGLDLRHSYWLTETPDFSSVPNLEELVLDGCIRLREIHSSTAHLNKLTLLNVSNCKSLKHFPCIEWLSPLQTLILSGCPGIEELPEISWHMRNLSKLCLDGTGITELPSSIGYATKLVQLDLKNCRKLKCLPSSIGKLRLLQILDLSGCLELKPDGSTIKQPPSSSIVLRNQEASLSSLPRSSGFIRHLSTLTSLRYLNLSNTSIIRLPWTIEGLSNLQRLGLKNCRRLEALPVLPSSIKRMDACNCISLKLIISPQSLLNSFGVFLFGNCFKLNKYLSLMEPYLQSMAANVDQDRWRSTYNDHCPHVQVPFSTIFPGHGIPDWFRYHGEGNEVNIEVPSNWYGPNFLGLAFSVVIESPSSSNDWGWLIYCNLNSGSSRICTFICSQTPLFNSPKIESDHLVLAYVPSFFGFDCQEWSHFKFSFSTYYDKYVVKSCGVCPVYNKGTGDGCSKKSWNGRILISGDC